MALRLALTLPGADDILALLMCAPQRGSAAGAIRIERR
jgi:hypothetical protein